MHEHCDAHTPHAHLLYNTRTRFQQLTKRTHQKVQTMFTTIYLILSFFCKFYLVEWIFQWQQDFDAHSFFLMTKALSPLSPPQITKCYNSIVTPILCYHQRRIYTSVYATRTNHTDMMSICTTQLSVLKLFQVGLHAALDSNFSYPL